MSKLFGRNQKRKMLNEINTLRDQVERKQRAIESRDDDISLVRSLLSNIDNALKIEAIEANPCYVKNNGYKIQQFDDRCSIYTGSLHDLVFKTSRIDPLVLDTYNDKLAGCKRYVFTWRGERYGYDMSDEYIQCMPKHVIEEQVARECARLVVG